MPLSDITKQAVLDAIREFNTLGRDKFLSEYHFGPARDYWLVYDGQRYDSKAITGVAHNLATGSWIKNFHGGYSTVQPTLQKLGFTVLVGSKSKIDELILPAECTEEPFDPSNIKDARERISQTIASRRGQGVFRDKLLISYDYQCAITGCAVVDALEAAHICPYRGPETNAVSNGLLLRADVHTLFDLGLISINYKNMKVVVHEELNGSEYWKFNGQKLQLPSESSQRPSKKALRMHFDSSRLR